MTNNTMTIRLPLLSRHSGTARLSTDILSPTGLQPLWFEVAHEHSSMLTETSDAFLVALLALAMRNRWDIIVEGSLSSRLYYNMTCYYMELLRVLIPNTEKITIHAPKLIQTNWGGKGVFTGFSAGIDSFCTIVDHRHAQVPPEYRITHLLFNNVGSHGQTADDLRIFQDRFVRLREWADAMSLPLVTVNSNLDALLGMGFQQTHTLRNLAVPLLLQKQCRKFLYSSTLHYRDVHVGPTHDIGHADAIGVSLLSTETTECISSGGQHTRFDKTRVVSSFPLSTRALDVCVWPNKATRTINCSRCWKCLRTELTLEVIGQLEHYEHVFDLDTYRKHRWIYLCNVLTNKDPLLREISQAIQTLGFPIPASAKLLVAILPRKMIDKIARAWSEGDANPWHAARLVWRQVVKKLLPA